MHHTYETNITSSFCISNNLFSMKLHKLVTDQVPWFFVRCITHMKQILLQVFVHLFHNFILIDNKIDKNLKLRLYGGRRYQMLILWLEHVFNYLFSIKLYKKREQDEIPRIILRIYPSGALMGNFFKIVLEISSWSLFSYNFTLNE